MKFRFRLGPGHLSEPMAGINASWTRKGPLGALRRDNQEIVKNKTVDRGTCALNRALTSLLS